MLLIYTINYTKCKNKIKWKSIINYKHEKKKVYIMCYRNVDRRIIYTSFLFASMYNCGRNIKWILKKNIKKETISMMSVILKTRITHQNFGALIWSNACQNQEFFLG